MSNALAVDMLGDTLERAGTHKSYTPPGKYSVLKMRPQTGLVPLSIEENGTPVGEVTIDFDPFYKEQMLNRRHTLTNRLRGMQPKLAETQPIPKAIRQPGTMMMFNRYSRNAQQNRASTPQIGTGPAKPANRAQLRMESEQLKPTKDLAALRKLEEMPTQGVKVPAQNIALPPEYLLRMRRQRMMALGYG